MRLKIVKHILNFARPAKTSRDVLHQREIYYFILSEPDGNKVGIGECAPIFGLSREQPSAFQKTLAIISNARSIEEIPADILIQNPSIVFALETAKHDLANGGKREVFPLLSKSRIPINGLVWMNEKEAMLSEALAKIDAGFNCIKLKIGGINFEDELEILNEIRNRYSPSMVEIRLDANGAFGIEDAFNKLERISKYDIHSIEQPIRKGQWKEMNELCKHSPIPIALDEELIAMDVKKEALLEAIQPHFIILKPTLHGGLEGCDQWIKAARERNIQWWATSALESNIGLNAIAQWLTTYDNPMPQGLGTGKLFVDNIPSPLQSGSGYFWWDEHLTWQVDSILNH